MEKLDVLKLTEVVTDKKKLPEKMDEFILFLSDYNSKGPATIHEFLDQYE